MTPPLDLRNLMTFETDIPNDDVWDGHGNLVTPGGRAVCEHIISRLNDSGLSCTDIRQHSFYGWDFTIGNGILTLRCIIQAGANGHQSWLLTFDERSGIFRRVFGASRDSGFSELLAQIQDVLSCDSRFSNVLRYAENDYDRGTG